MIPLQAFKVCVHRASDLRGIFDGDKMANDLGVMACLSGKSLFRLLPIRDFLVRHHLDDLEWLGHFRKLDRPLGQSTIHQLRTRIEVMEQHRLEAINFPLVLNRKSPNKRYLPDVDLTISDDV